MSIKQLYIYSFIFSAISGLINIYCIKHLNLVVTNATGHFSAAILEAKENIPATLGYILFYALGAFWSYSCFNYGQKKGIHWLKTLPVVANICIFSYAVLTQTLPTLFLLFAMSGQNAIGSNHSDARVKPSQITGVLMNAMQDLSVFLFGNKNIETATNLIAKILNIIGFMAGGLVAYHFDFINILWLPIVFYVVVLNLILIKKI